MLPKKKKKKKIKKKKKLKKLKKKMENDFSVKIIILGVKNVGKTILVYHLVNDSPIDTSFSTTLGVSYQEKLVLVNGNLFSFNLSPLSLHFFSNIIKKI